MADFGKLNFSTSFNPTSAFPLDARSYFEGKDAFEKATAAAVLAEEVGSTNTIYHYGQKLLVNQNGVYTWYVIQTDNTLKPEGTGTGSSSGLPSVTKADDGKILTVSGGQWVAAELPKYDGAFSVTPSTEDQTLSTALTYLDADIKVEKIPYAEVSNISGGSTVTIGGN